MGPWSANFRTNHGFVQCGDVLMVIVLIPHPHGPL